VHRALHELPVEAFDLLFVENVGNLVCPAIYDLGQAANVVVLSVTEGEDKPLKYPVMFRKADLVVISKIDLLPHLPDLRPEAFQENLAQVMPEPRAIEVSATTGEGLGAWIAWLKKLSDGMARETPRPRSLAAPDGPGVRPPPLPAWPSGEAEGE
jgi:hydrogenase nickel incorporation protein HypB